MEDWITKAEPPPPVVLVPPLFDFPPLATRSRMVESSYDFLFTKVSRACLFADYFEESGKMMAKIMLRPVDDPRVDFIATLQGPFGKSTEMGVKGDAVFRWQRDPEDPNTFVDIKMSNLYHLHSRKHWRGRNEEWKGEIVVLNPTVCVKERAAHTKSARRIECA